MDPLLLLLTCVRTRLGTRKNYAKHYLQINATTFKQRCPQLDFLSPLQQELCSLHPNVLHTISRGARFGIEECQYQFKMNRWNCSAMDSADSVFGPIIDINSREKAFIHAISTAGVVYSVTRACTKGELSQCGCDDKVKSQDVQGKWDWGGCSDDIYYGAEFSRRFIDSIEDPNQSEGVMNLHNNEVGRRVIKSKMELVCKCHGISGSCTVKVCWRRLKPFREVGEELAQKFDGATHVKIVQSRKKRSRLKPAQKNVRRPSKRDLVYLEDSPDFCFHNGSSHGSFGTTDRICNATSLGLDGCRYLCCGRGYRTIENDVDLKCNCKFVWCCQVKCDLCRQRIIEHRCN
uniref:Protein Wnt n=1 Tax=Dermatophagoides pteronyssinus TaxID=6956 RepID=A0A6P6YMX3_DERPT|nr:protein Wnt-1-like [Dermatophagoides pteronyssinus]